MPPACSMATFFRSLSTQTTSWPTSAKHAPVTNPTYPVPTMETLAIESVLRTRRAQINPVHSNAQAGVGLERERKIDRGLVAFRAAVRVPKSVVDEPIMRFLPQRVRL